MASKVPIFHLKRLDFLVIYDCPWADALRQVKYSSEINPFRVKYCPTLLAIEYIVMTSLWHFIFQKSVNILYFLIIVK